MSLNRVRVPFVLALAAALALPALAIPPGTDAEIAERLKPYGAVSRVGDGSMPETASTGGGEPLTGEQVYNQYCFACHATGASGAPKFGDAAEWAPRIAKGMDALMASTLNGFNVMPARGTCMNCSDDELHAAVEYMVDHSE
jgi:cytochrome c5